MRPRRRNQHVDDMPSAATAPAATPAPGQSAQNRPRRRRAATRRKLPRARATPCSASPSRRSRPPSRTPAVVVETARTCARRPVLDCSRNSDAGLLTGDAVDVCRRRHLRHQRRRLNAAPSAPHAAIHLTRAHRAVVRHLRRLRGGGHLLLQAARGLVDHPAHHLTHEPAAEQLLAGLVADERARVCLALRELSGFPDFLNGLIRFRRRKLRRHRRRGGEVNEARRVARRPRLRRPPACDDANLGDDARLVGAVEARTSTPARRGACGASQHLDVARRRAAVFRERAARAMRGRVVTRRTARSGSFSPAAWRTRESANLRSSFDRSDKNLMQRFMSLCDDADAAQRAACGKACQVRPRA